MPLAWSRNPSASQTFVSEPDAEGNVWKVSLTRASDGTVAIKFYKNASLADTTLPSYEFVKDLFLNIGPQIGS